MTAITEPSGPRRAEWRKCVEDHTQEYWGTTCDACLYLPEVYARMEALEALALADERSAGAAPIDAAIRRICKVLDNDEGGAELYEAALELYRARLASEGTDR